MAYKFVEFDGVSLPLYNHSQEHAPMPSESALMDSIGGATDWVGTGRRKGRKQGITLKGVFVGETTYLVDSSGNYLVDDLGNYIIAGDSEQMLRSQVDDLLRKKGVTGSLVRRRLDDGTEQWKTARLLSVPWPRVWEDHAVKAEITCQFETRMEFWHASTQTTTSVSATAATATLLSVENVGETVDDAVITVTRTSGTITAFSLTCTELGIGLVWTGSIGSGGVLTIDCGAQTVIKDTTDSYSGFGLSSHTAAGWLPLPVGTHLCYVTVLGGNATVAIKHYTQTA